MNKFNTWAEETAVRLQESIPVKRLSIPLPSMNGNSHGTAMREDVTDNN